MEVITKIDEEEEYTVVVLEDIFRGKDATINGYNTIEIQAGNNITLEQNENILKINSKAYDDTDIKQEVSSLSDVIINKADKSDIPDVSKFVTKSTNDLINYYLKDDTYTKTEIMQLIGTIKGVSMKIVPEKPTTGESNIIYLIPSAKSKTENIYDEYIYINDKWEIIGSTAIDLSNYYTIEQINTLLYDYITSNDLEETLDSIKYTYVKDGLVNNNIQLSDEEQIKIETWLGLSHNYLTYYNTIPYSVNSNYIPAHKKYVDDKIEEIDDKIGTLNDLLENRLEGVD